MTVRPVTHKEGQSIELPQPLNMIATAISFIFLEYVALHIWATGSGRSSRNLQPTL